MAVIGSPAKGSKVSTSRTKPFTPGVDGSTVPIARPKPWRVLTNKSWLGDRLIDDREVECIDLSGASSLGGRCAPWALWKYDAVFLDGHERTLLVACAIKKVLPFVRCRIASVDVILARPRGWRAKMLFRLRRWLLSSVDRFVLYFRDTAQLEQVYDIPHSKIRHVPFKANTLEHLRELAVRDDGYFLACGRSNRDYDTLFEAFRGLDETCVVLAPWGQLTEHGTWADVAKRPPNVELVSDDGTAASWNQWIAAARAIVLPIEPGMLSPSGIGTYLVAMALGKCVIITHGPATNGLLHSKTAVLLPPADAEALRAAVKRVSSDVLFRESIAARGQEYALSLGGEERLRHDLQAELADLLAS